MHGLKPFWNDHLSDLKVMSIVWCNMWRDAGKPKVGHMFSIKTACALQYKNAFKHPIYEFEHKFDNALYDHLCAKSLTNFGSVGVVNLIV